VNYVDAKPSAIHLVGLDVRHQQTVARQQRLWRAERIVFEMFVADRRKRVALQSHGQMVHLNYPNAFFHNATVIWFALGNGPF
jgi:hypothetical protein